MSEDKFREFEDDFALFIEAGFVAVKQLDEISASRLFEAAQVLRPDDINPRLGKGYIALNKLEIKEAQQIFEGILQVQPDDQLCQVFLGMCFMLTKDKLKKGEKVIREVQAKATDPTIKNLCQLSLQWGEKDLSKRNKQPFFMQSSKEEGE